LLLLLSYILLVGKEGAEAEEEEEEEDQYKFLQDCTV
jgi:hypothetical protein